MFNALPFQFLTNFPKEEITVNQFYSTFMSQYSVFKTNAAAQLLTSEKTRSHQPASASSLLLISFKALHGLALSSDAEPEPQTLRQDSASRSYSKTRFKTKGD